MLTLCLYNNTFYAYFMFVPCVVNKKLVVKEARGAGCAEKMLLFVVYGTNMCHECPACEVGTPTLIAAKTFLSVSVITVSAPNHMKSAIQGTTLNTDVTMQVEFS